MKYFGPNYISAFVLLSLFLVACSKDETNPNVYYTEEVGYEGILINGELENPTYYFCRLP
ncbi:hypothetical protein [Zobellia nedashkovskayae]|uniref:hypothetical protein n=1 Tax=Zobellia nedashkovskayae TaxID=2779510 RepID=UPI0039F0BB7C